jgi:hypothetical protein
VNLGWQRKFEDPIPLSDGRSLTLLPAMKRLLSRQILSKADEMTPNCEARDLRHSIDHRNAFLGSSIAGERGTLDGARSPAADEIDHAALQVSATWTRRPALRRLVPFSYFWNLLKRHFETTGKILLTHFDLVSARPNAFTECNVRILDPPSVVLVPRFCLMPLPYAATRNYQISCRHRSS